jgi:hypothetical protein
MSGVAVDVCKGLPVGPDHDDHAVVRDRGNPAGRDGGEPDAASPVANFVAPALPAGWAGVRRGWAGVAGPRSVRRCAHAGAPDRNRGDCIVVHGRPETATAAPGSTVAVTTFPGNRLDDGHHQPDYPHRLRLAGHEPGRGGAAGGGAGPHRSGAGLRYSGHRAGRPRSPAVFPDRRGRSERVWPSRS